MITFILLFFLQIPSINCQPGDDCANMAPICTTEDPFVALGANYIGFDGSNYDCIHSPYHPSWWYLKIENVGDIYMSLSAEFDINFILWGPFPNLYAAQSQCGSLGYGNSSFNGVADCSDSWATIETLRILSAHTDEIYVLLVNTYADFEQDLRLTLDYTQTSTATTDCSILETTDESSLNSGCSALDIDGFLGHCSLLYGDLQNDLAQIKADISEHSGAISSHKADLTQIEMNHANDIAALEISLQTLRDEMNERFADISQYNAAHFAGANSDTFGKNENEFLGLDQNVILLISMMTNVILVVFACLMVANVKKQHQYAMVSPQVFSEENY